MNRNSSKSLFVVSTPAQAFFLSLAPQLIEDKSVLILTVKKKKEEQDILKHLHSFSWQKIYIWYLPTSNSKQQYIKIISIRIKLFWLKINLSDIEKIYFGSYTNTYHLSIAAEFKGSNKFLLYDGMQMISVAELRSEGETKLEKYPLLHRILGYKLPHLNAINYISPIVLKELAATDSLYLIKNSVKIEEKKYNENKCYFIGNNLPGIGIVSKEFYLNTLIRLKEEYANKEIIYIAHPREDDSILPIIGKIFPVLRLDEILEEHFLSSTEFPGRVFSFCSSVLVNLIFLDTKSKLIAITIPASKIEKENYIKPLLSLQSYFEQISNKNFSVQDLNV